MLNISAYAADLVAVSLGEGHGGRRVILSLKIEGAPDAISFSLSLEDAGKLQALAANMLGIASLMPQQQATVSPNPSLN